MVDASTSVINFGDLSKPATVLIEKVSDAVGGIFLPYQIERVAKAQAKAEKIRAVSSLKITMLQKRAFRRLLQEESDKQRNIESITQKALPELTQTSNPKDIERDWLINFFDKARMISDSDMQELWSKILAGEANTPGTFSKRTINMIASLDKRDATLFNSLSNFVWNLGETTDAIIFDAKAKIYNDDGIDFEALTHLDSIGLISFEPLTGYIIGDLPQNIRIFYKGRSLSIAFPKKEKNELNVGKVLLTSVGRDLIRICDTKTIEGFMEYVIGQWNHDGNIINPL
jgi:hypothetical protein